MIVSLHRGVERFPTAVDRPKGVRSRSAPQARPALSRRSFCHAFGSPNSFNVLSLEYTDRGAVAERVLGNENLILQPDAARAKFALLGTNPLVTNGMTLLQRRPRIAADIKAIQRGGGKVVVVDPRRTETAKVANEHVPIRPGTDLFLLVAMIRRILETNRYDRAFIERHAVGFETWRRLAELLDPRRAAQVTGITREQIERLADQFAAADGAFATTRVGVQTSPNTTLTEGKGYAEPGRCGAHWSEEWSTGASDIDGRFA